MRTQAANRPTLLLALGAAAGIVAAAVGLVGSGGSAARSMPPDAAATVNGQAIRKDDLQRLLNGIAQERREPLDEALRRRILDRLIDEELLVQRGLELGLARHDPRVRRDLSAAVIDSIVAEQESGEPSDAELQQFYTEHRDFFASPPRLRVRQVWVRVASPSQEGAALERARDATRRLRAGEDFTAVRDALGDAELAPLPDAPLPPTKLADYLGPTALRGLQSMPNGAVGDPVRSSSGYHVLQLLERQADAEPALSEIRAQVRAELVRNRADAALRAYLDGLRRKATVAIAPGVP